MNRTDWYGCYDGSWQSAPLVAEAYAHPAKVSFNLAERIYRHMLTEGWLSPGDVVLDPFGGVGGFAFHAALYGMHWTGVELEQKFVTLGNQNLELWRNRYAPHFPGYGSARLVQGDSRRLVEVVTGAGGVVSSPPYVASIDHAPGNKNWVGAMPGNIKQDSYGTTPGQLGAMPAGAVVSSPPYAQSHIGADDNPYANTGGKSMGEARNGHLVGSGNYGTTPGQLGAMPAGAVVSSPPYAANISANDAANDSDARRERKAAAGIDMTDARNVGGPNSVLNRAQSYGHTDGNLGNMPAGVVTSPPYQTGGHHDGVFDTWGGEIGKTDTPAWSRLAKDDPENNGYGDHPDQLTGKGDTFWSAAQQIVAQCYAILRPGGYAAFVTGDFVRAKKRVPFGEQWLALCESVGFEPVLWATAWKSESHGEQLDIFGNGHEQGKTKVSFFRRLANQKLPDTAIVNEDAIFVRKPL